MTRMLAILVMLGWGNVCGQDSLNMSRLGSFSNSAEVRNVDARGSIAFIAQRGAGISSVNVSSHSSPLFLDNYDIGDDDAHDLFLDANILYVAYRSAKVRLLDVTDPSNLIEMSWIDTPGNPWGVLVRNNILYVSSETALVIYDVTSPVAPAFLGQVTLDDAYKSVLAYPTLYLARRYYGVSVIDVSNPSSPTLVSTLDTPGSAHGMCIQNDILYVADFAQGIARYDISVPTDPAPLPRVVVPGNTWDAEIVLDRLCVASGAAGLRVFDVLNLAEPELVARYDDPGESPSAEGLAAIGPYLYVAENTRLSIYEVLLSPIRFVNLIAPNGSEHLPIYSSYTIRWMGTGFDGGVTIELNRRYPVGDWEMIAESTENDGAYEWFVTDPLSDSCRIRVCAIEDTFCDISDGNFSIESSQGYLALARSSVPNLPVTAWNAGTVECPEVESQWFRLKNFGSESIVVFQPQEPASAEFARQSNCGAFFALAPNQMSTCSLQISFTPGADGTYNDVLRIQTDAVNGVNGLVEFALAGTQISTPSAPEVVLTTQGEDAVLYWSAVDTSVGGSEVEVERYLVFYAPSSNGPFYYHGWTAATTYTHLGVVTYAPAQFYQIVAVDLPEAALAGLERGMDMTEVLARLPGYRVGQPRE